MWTEWSGVQPGSKDHIFLTRTGTHHKTSHKLLRGQLDKAAVRAGLRGTKEGKRHPVPTMNGFRRFFNKTWKDSMAADSRVGSFVRGEYLMGHKGMTSLDKNYFQTNLLELAAAYAGIAPNLIIDDALRLKQSNNMMSVNIQELQKEKESSVAELKKEVADLRQKNLVIADMLERVKAERDGAANADSKLVADLARRLQDQDEAIRRMSAEHGEEMGKMSKMVDKLYSVMRDETELVNSSETETRTGSDGKTYEVYSRRSRKSRD